MMTINNLQELLHILGMKTPADQITPDLRDGLGVFLKKEQEFRREWKIKRLMASSGIRTSQLRTFDQIDWGFNTKLPKEDILTFKNSSWIDDGANLLLIGDAGLGKSHIAKALCYEAILKGHSALFVTAFDLIAKIKRAPNLAARIEYYGNAIKVLALDELGYTCHAKDDGDLLFQIISKRSERYPTIVTTNLAPKQWGSLFSGPAASAILDRLSYNGKFITMEGKSYRLRSKQK
jgi:DNA replication protein DnaC